MLGIPLAIAARAASRPKLAPKSLIRPIRNLMAVMAVCALSAGITGWLLARADMIRLFGDIAEAVTADRHIPILADLWTHNASYIVGFIGGIVVIAKVWRSRIVNQR